MKRIFCLLILVLSFNNCNAQIIETENIKLVEETESTEITETTEHTQAPSDFDFLRDKSQAIYSLTDNSWHTGNILEEVSDDNIVLNKELFEGTGSYSIYRNQDGSLAFALATGDEFIKNGKLVIIDNNLLKYSQMVYQDGEFREVELTCEEIGDLFPDAEILKISWIDSDNKIWIHKPFLKKKTFILVNDTDKFFHKLHCKRKNVQHNELKGLITISHYGFYRFKHYGERDGRLFFYVR